MVKIIIAVVLGICALITPVLSTSDRVSADTLPISNSIYAPSGTPNEQNPFTLLNNVYFSNFLDWSDVYLLEDKTSYVFNGVEFTGADDFTFGSDTYSLVMWFNGTMPNIFKYYVWVHDFASYESMNNTSTVSRFFDRNGNIIYSNTNNNIFTGVTSSDGTPLVTYYESNTFRLYEFAIPSNCARFEINVRLATSSVLVPFLGISYGFVYNYETIFDEGYQVGYSDGYSEGRTYADSTININSASYQAGYTKGVEESSNLFELFSSAVSAPVNVLMDTFNFEILGVNVSTFILSLLTLGFIVIVVKLLI